jgi:dinuclear metal center YbgI/SA1388 family protein
VTTVADILAAVDRLAPFALAEAWDNVGLLLGDPDAPVTRLLVALDTSDAVCDEADRLGADCLLTHHPMIFTSVDRLTARTRAGRLALRLASAGRAVVAAHTNLDAAPGGLGDRFAGMLGLRDVVPLAAADHPKPFKVVVFVPESSLEAVRSAAFDADARRIVDYHECRVAVAGTGTFHPGEGATPAVGSTGRRNAVPELRLEFLCPASRLGAVTAAVVRAHPYEEPVVDVYALRPAPASAGIGRVGRLESPKTGAQLADEIRGALGIPAVRLAGPTDVPLERVAVCNGAGGALRGAARAARADAFVTGELKYHEAQELEAVGMTVLVAGHYETERAPLERWLPDLDAVLDVPVTLSESERALWQTH